MAKVTVLILAKDEAAVIERCIRSASFADEIVVVDSESADRTREIAASLGARVVTQPWLGWLPQKAVGVAAASHDWIFSLDADEIVTLDLAMDVRRALQSDPDPADGFVLEREEEFLGAIMPNMRRRSKRKSFVRLFNRTRSGWDPKLVIHEEIVCPGRLVPLEGKLIHWRNYTIARQLDTFNRNAELESRMIVESDGFSLAKLVVKPLARFGWIYLVCGHWRMGVRGFVWAWLFAFAEFLRYAKAWEAIATVPAPHPPAVRRPADFVASDGAVR